MKRKIAAILAADIVGYSKLVAEDEEETLRRLGTCRAVFSDFVARYGGRIFNTAGDATLAEFQSAVDAIRCAVDVQESLRTRNLAYPSSRHMSFRIGITIGDVVERDGDLLGDGVNIASRLESFAPAGGICISRSVHEAVTKKISLKFDDLGLLHLKNIPDRVHAYTVALDRPERRRAASLTAWRVLGTVAVLMIAVLGIGVFLFTRSILPLGTASGVGPTSPPTVAVEQDKTTLSQARTDSPSASPSDAREPKLDEADRKTAAADAKLAAPARRDETRPPAATAAGPTVTPAPEQSSSTPEQNEEADKEGDSCRRYLPSVGKTVEVPCERAQERAQEPGKAVETTEGGRTEVQVFMGQWGTSETPCKGGLKKNERLLIFGPGSAQYLAGYPGDFTCSNVKISESSSAMSLTALCRNVRWDCEEGGVCHAVQDSSGDLSLHTSGEQIVGFGPDGQELQLRRCDAP